MGYEVTMYAVEKYDNSRPDSTYASIVGMVELCKISYGEVANIDAKRPESPKVYIYGADGNTKIERDCYAKPLGVYSPQTVLDALKADNKRERYRRYDMAIALLESAIPVFGDELTVLFYGH